MNSGQIPRDSHARNEPGRIVAAFGRHVLVEDSAQARHPCILAGRRLRPVCGDCVSWQRPLDDSDGLVIAIEPRKTELARPSRRGDREILAANVSQVIVVAAPEPAPDSFLVDRYLVAAELMGTDACLAYNKTDLDPDCTAMDLGEFEDLGYPVLRICARDNSGLDGLRERLKGQTSILVGHSGAGKSSIINSLLPDVQARTASLSAATGEGRHTTTASVLHHIPTGGELIDSPGVRDYAPPPVDRRDVARGFREISARAVDCQFSDCLHLEEPGCAIKAAVAADQISGRRYESYRRLVRLMERLGSR